MEVRWIFKTPPVKKISGSEKSANSAAQPPVQNDSIDRTVAQYQGNNPAIKDVDPKNPPLQPLETAESRTQLPGVSSFLSFTPISGLHPGNTHITAGPAPQPHVIDINAVEAQPGTVVSPIIRPAEYQVASYNIYPTLLFEVKPPLLSPAFMTATLVEHITQEEIKGGIVTASPVEVMQNQIRVEMRVKLGKLRVIKAQVSRDALDVDHNPQFQVKVSLAGVIAFTSPFRIVSSCSQLPNDIRSRMRPQRASLKQRKSRPPPHPPHPPQPEPVDEPPPPPPSATML